MPSLVVLVLHDLKPFDEVLQQWHAAGAPAVTVLDCVGTRGLREAGRYEDLPILPRIRDLLQGDDAPRKLVFSVVPDELVDPIIKVTEEATGDLMEPGNGILFVVSVARVVGLRAPDAPAT